MRAFILCYHKVGPENEQGRYLNVHPRRLGQQARFFQRRGFTFVRARDLAQPWPKRVVCLTFDDAYASTCENGLPVLSSLGVTATLFAVPGLVGDASRWDGPIARPLAGWDALREAQRMGFEIGNHSMTHPRLSQLEPEAQKAEIVAAHERLRAEGLEPGSFCYPYGSENASARQVVQESGYRVALVLGKRLATSGDPLLALPRVVVAYGDTLPLLLYKMHIRPKLRRKR